jgi:hypothetical protein
MIHFTCSKVKVMKYTPSLFGICLLVLMIHLSHFSLFTLPFCLALVGVLHQQANQSFKLNSSFATLHGAPKNPNPSHCFHNTLRLN